MPGDDITSASRETAYVWDIASDRLEWQPGASTVLGISNLSAIATGEAFAARILPEHQAAWRSAVLGRRTTAGSAPHGIPYRVQFALESGEPNAAAPIWLEDRGRWWPGPDGRPSHASGVLLRIDARYLESRRLHLPPGDDTRETLNRTRLFEAIGARAKRTERTARASGLLMIAVNGLDAINTRLGPDLGDEVIAAVGRLVEAGLAETDAIVRYASNTFAVVVDGCAPDDLSAAAERLIARVEAATVETSAGALKASISVGAAALPDMPDTAAATIAQARNALERAKRAQGARYVVHSGKEMSPPPCERSMTGEVMSAIEENRLILALQPIVDARSAQTVFYEGLLRLKRRDGTLVAAADFIEEAEQLGLAKLLDRRALELALALLAAHPGLKLCLNVSSLTSGDKDWIATLEASAATHADLAARLMVEITETAMIHDLEGVRAFVELLRNVGCRIAIDDFGTGYTSFRHLKTLPVDMLKIDGIFMQDLPHDHQGRVIVSAMIEMAKGLGLETVAEWVSDRETAEFLAAAGATYLQGFLFAEPRPAEDFERNGEL